MKHFICIACGAQYPASATSPEVCRICIDERQPYPVGGQRWTAAAAIATVHCNHIRPVESGLFRIRTEPVFAIGQYAYLVQTNEGNILWDCLSVLDPMTFGRLEELGGVQAIGLSHPHFYGAVLDWSSAFGHVPIYVHEKDRQWVVRPDPAFRFWSGERLQLTSSLTIVHCGGHFPGSSVLWWAQGAEGRGVVLVSDTVYICPDGLWVSFMFSYPCYIPLCETEVTKIWRSFCGLGFDRLYGAFEAIIQSGAPEKIERSAARYIACLRGERLSG